MVELRNFVFRSSPGPWCRAPRWAAALLLLIALTAVGAPTQEASSEAQLDVVRARIRQLESEVGELQRQSATVEEERHRLDAELGLAEARVREVELLLTASRDEIVELREEAARLSGELEERRRALQRHLEMILLLGRPGPIQLFYDAMRGGDLEKAVGTVSVLTAAQLRLIQEYEAIQTERSAHLASLSRRMETARGEAEELIARRGHLKDVRARVDRRLEQLQRSQRIAGNRLAEMRSRAEALERLLGVVRERRAFAGKEDIRGFRGALPWPADGRVAQTFGKHYLPKYSTYTVCNGLRLHVDGNVEAKAIFPGEVAYARHFKGYGNMVVIDHGHGVYSLVAGLATIHVRLNQRVTMGTRLGLTSPSDDEGNLYLEIRVGENPQDPRRWLQLKEGRS